jgi:hypothetical protein
MLRALLPSAVDDVKEKFDSVPEAFLRDLAKDWQERVPPSAIGH